MSAGRERVGSGVQRLYYHTFIWAPTHSLRGSEAIVRGTGAAWVNRRQYHHKKTMHAEMKVHTFLQILTFCVKLGSTSFLIYVSSFLHGRWYSPNFWPSLAFFAFCVLFVTKQEQKLFVVCVRVVWHIQSHRTAMQPAIEKPPPRSASQRPNRARSAV